MHFVGVALLCATLGAAGSYLLPEIVTKKEVGPTPADAKAAGAKEVRVGEMPTASALAGAT